MKNKHYYSKYWIVAPASCSKRKYPKDNGSYGSFDSIRDIDRVCYPVEFPVKASNVEYDTKDQTEKENNKGKPCQRTGYKLIHFLLL
jgi:hypothetical protein